MVSGTIAADAGQVNQTCSVKNPAAFSRTLFIEALERKGIDVTARATGGNPGEKLPEKGNYSGSRKVAEITSPPLIEDVKLTLKVSQNMHANSYIMLLAMASNKTSFYEGMKGEGRILSSLGLDTMSISLGDGAGGVNEDRISPRIAAHLLTIMHTRPYAERFVKAQPILGVDGSLATSCGVDNPACGHVYAKTGTSINYDPMNDRAILFAKSLAGYVDTKSGKRIVFAVYANNVPISSLDDMTAVGEDLGSIAGRIYEYY
jgi:D-alanyl-D-alanine carboxypeptidase/D-alanyl-D-alanine-endopeptidase (penicillin-binding protein 4)